MEIIKVTQKEWVGEAEKYIRYALHKTAYLVVETPVVGVYSKLQVDEALCNDLGYEVVETFNNASTVVHNTGDILFGHFDAIDNNWYDRFVINFVQWLKYRGLNAEFVNNDIVVDGYKVCGMCVTRYGAIDYTAGFIGINTNVENIKQICRKPMEKIPKGLSEYGITTSDVEGMLSDFCNREA